jgi:hypothetical protein
MARFNPDFCFTFEPGFSFVPAADFDRLRTFRSPITTTAWFWLIGVVVWCRKSLRILAILRSTALTFTLAFRQFRPNFAAPGHPALVAFQACLLLRQRLARVDHFTVGKRCETHHAQVDATRRACTI